MNLNKLSAMPNRQTRADLTVSFSLALVAVFFVASGLVSWFNIRTLNLDSEQITRTHDTILTLNNIQSIMKDAETGQRGFVLTGQEDYLAPYTEALTRVETEEIALRQETLQEPEQQARLGPLKAHINAKLAELARTIALRRAQGFQPALDLVLTNQGKADMDAIRVLTSAMQATENARRTQAVTEMERAYMTALISTGLAGLLGVIITIAIIAMISRASAVRRKQDWLQAGQVGLSSVMMGEQRLDQLGNHILTFLADYCHAHAGAFFVKDGGLYRQAATYGVPANSDVPKTFGQSDGLLAQAAGGDKPILVENLPDQSLTIGSALGQWRPRHLILAPARSDGLVDAVFELGFINAVPPNTIELMAKISEFVSVAVRSANYRLNLQNLLEETQRQSEELQSQSEELRVNNEELEEQGRALKESHARLEQQQAELEQTNSQLEEQATALENQRDVLARTTADVEEKARELGQASQYKSDFLANMSHELRTPLNSSLILAKLLADNKAGNLTEEQVKFAQTIQSSGNDLLALINDILDLSKIEAGHMELRIESVSLSRLASDMARVFDPIAKQKALTFKTEIAEGLTEAIETDRQRLEQVLKNLLSNAFKFTEKGAVDLTFALTRGGHIAIAVKDTGVGISQEQQQAVFDAFRQADGTISRKYGGTGLGLSISRELARLLGGTISLDSTPGAGSTFTVTLPVAFAGGDGAVMAPPPLPTLKKSAAKAKAIAAETTPSDTLSQVHDDRDRLTGEMRSILVIEDDESFARILYDLAHDLDFLCLLAHTAEDALIVARQYVPSAIVMDIGLPDNSGLSVLDRLKRDPRLRHIPVHVVSASDYTHTALSLGAIGYMLKPVKREELVDAFKQLESRLSRRVRRILIVEDDAVQRDSVAALLKSIDVETVAVGTAKACLEQLKEATFDCMVLDLSLPDASGYSLLEALSKEDAYSFPPVIVYTGRDLSAEDEQQLRRYSKSIIIKGVKSPERLLDEVTLFLHQVVSELSPQQQLMLKKAKNRDAVLEGRRILIVEDDVRNVYAVTNILEPLGAVVQIARNGLEALEALEKATAETPIDLVLMDVMMPEMDGLTATREIRKKAKWRKLPVIMLTAKAMKDDQERCMDAGANDYMAKPLDVEKLISLVRVWMPR